MRFLPASGCPSQHRVSLSLFLFLSPFSNSNDNIQIDCLDVDDFPTLVLRCQAHLVYAMRNSNLLFSRHIHHIKRNQFAWQSWERNIHMDFHPFTCNACASPCQPLFNHHLPPPPPPGGGPVPLLPQDPIHTSGLVHHQFRMHHHTPEVHPFSPHQIQNHQQRRNRDNPPGRGAHPSILHRFGKGVQPRETRLGRHFLVSRAVKQQQISPDQNPARSIRINANSSRGCNVVSFLGCDVSLHNSQRSYLCLFWTSAPLLVRAFSALCVWIGFVCTEYSWQQSAGCLYTDLLPRTSLYAHPRCSIYSARKDSQLAFGVYCWLCALQSMRWTLLSTGYAGLYGCCKGHNAGCDWPAPWSLGA